MTSECPKEATWKTDRDGGLAGPGGPDRRCRYRAGGERTRAPRAACRSPFCGPIPAIRAKSFEEADLADPTASIREKGIVQPILVPLDHRRRRGL